MTIVYEDFSDTSPAEPHEPEHRDVFRDLRGRSPEEIRGVITILAAMRSERKMPVETMAQVQAKNEAEGDRIGCRLPNKFDHLFEQILLEYGTHPEGPEGTPESSIQIIAFDDGASGQQPVV